MIHVFPTSFTADAAPEGKAVEIRWTISDVLSDLSGLADHRAFTNIDPEYDGVTALVKKRFEFSRGVADPENTLLWVGTQTAGSFYFKDDGGVYDGSGVTSYPITDGDPWTFDAGYGLAGGVLYFYTLFMMDSARNFHFSRTRSQAYAYAFGEWGLHQWLYHKGIPGHYSYLDQQNKEDGDEWGALEAFLLPLARSKEAVKTSIERMHSLINFDDADPQTLTMLEKSRGWPADTSLPLKMRKAELLAATTTVKARGLLDAFTSLIDEIADYADCTVNVRPGNQNVIFANGANGFSCLPDAYDATSVSLDGLLINTDFYVGSWIRVLSGTGAGQTRLITASTPLDSEPVHGLVQLTVAAWDTPLDSTSVVQLLQGTPALSTTEWTPDLVRGFWSPLLRTNSGRTGNSMNGILIEITLGPAPQLQIVLNAISRLSVFLAYFVRFSIMIVNDIYEDTVYPCVDYEDLLGRPS